MSLYIINAKIWNNVHSKQKIISHNVNSHIPEYYDPLPERNLQNRIQNSDTAGMRLSLLRWMRRLGLWRSMWFMRHYPQI